jgi:hypothetical protein
VRLWRRAERPTQSIFHAPFRFCRAVLVVRFIVFHVFNYITKGELMPPPYKPVGRCIYCGNNFPPSELSLEHIIPLSIGGKLKLPQASCLGCARKTSRVENRCIETFFAGVKPHLGLRGRKQKKPRHYVKTEIAWLDHSDFEKIPLHEHPGILGVFAFLPPGILGFFPQRERMEGIICPVFLYPDSHTRTKSHFHKPIVLARNLNAEIYARLLAKIAHAYTVAELGMDGFKPFLVNLILGVPPLRACYFVGGNTTEGPPAGKIPPPSKEQHEISFVELSLPFTPPLPRPPNLIIVRIRLFSNLATPIHYVVVGELPA